MSTPGRPEPSPRTSCCRTWTPSPTSSSAPGARAALGRGSRPDVVHSHFWMSGLAALTAARRLHLPVVHTFHALGVVKRRYQGDGDPSPPERMEVERDIVRDAERIVATCTDEAF